MGGRGRLARILVTGLGALAILAGVGLATADPGAAGQASARTTRIQPPNRPAVPVASYPVAAIRASADWILRAQYPNGAIADYVDKATASPYGAGYAAFGLARAGAVTGDATYTDAAWRWLDWYAAQERTSTYVTDFKAADGILVSTGSQDSTDAYAGMFLVAAGGAWDATQDRTRLAALAPGLEDAIHAIESTQDTDGLTWAKPSYHVKYAMDEAETYAGLVSAAKLELALGNTRLSQEAKQDADRLHQGFEQLWNPTTGAYDWALHSDGFRQPTDWHALYPDALEELWPVAFGLVTGPRAQTVVRHFAAVRIPDWATGAGNYWAVGAWAFQRVGLTGTASMAAASITRVSQQSGLAWPFTTADAGQLIVLESGGFSS